MIYFFENLIDKIILMYDFISNWCINVFIFAKILINIWNCNSKEYIMKKLLFIAIVLFCLSANAQDIIKPNKDRFIISLDEVKKDMQQYKPREYSNVKDIVETGMSKNDMWINLKKWVSSSFNSYEHVVDVEDEKLGIFVIKWKNVIYLNSSEYVKLIASSTIKIDVKENKYRYTVSDAQIVIKPNVGRVSDMGSYSLQRAIKDLEFIKHLYTTYYNGNEQIPMDKKFKTIVLYYKEKYESTPIYRDEKKKKTSEDWLKAYREYEILKEINIVYSKTNQLIISSLNKKMIEKDEW